MFILQKKKKIPSTCLKSSWNQNWHYFLSAHRASSWMRNWIERNWIKVFNQIGCI